MNTSPAKDLQIGDTFRFNLLGSKWMRVVGFREYRNAKNTSLECGGMTKVADVHDERGRSQGITVFPDQRLIIMGRGEFQ